MRKKIANFALAGVLTLSLILPQAAFAAETSANNNIGYLQSVMDMIKEKYKGEITEAQLMEGALKGMFGTMDAYTEYFTPTEATTFFDEVGGKYEGIGVMVSKEENALLVSKVFHSSPAEKAGIIQGDRIVTVGGKSVSSISFEEAVSLIRGEIDTEAEIGVVKSGQNTVVNIKVKRAQIKVSPVSYEIRDGIGYIKLEIFNSNTDEYMSEALEEMDKKGITKLILDLRGNPGGELGQSIAVAKKFVPKGLITKLDYKSDTMKDEEYFSKLESTKYKLAVLVDGMSASASEIVSGAIQDTKAGTLIGTKTFGKAKVQTVTPLLTPEAYTAYENKLGVKLLNAYDLLQYKIVPLKSEVIGYTKITVGEYVTPKGRMIDQIGLEPDIKVEDSKPVNEVFLNSIGKLEVVSKFDLNSEGVDVYNAEKILKAAGYIVDKPDNKIDENTFKAIAKFQKDRGIYPYGVLDLTTQKALNERLHKLVLEYDKQYTKAVEILNQ